MQMFMDVLLDAMEVGTYEDIEIGLAVAAIYLVDKRTIIQVVQEHL
jgi:hypothetical protein